MDEVSVSGVGVGGVKITQIYEHLPHRDKKTATLCKLSLNLLFSVIIESVWISINKFELYDNDKLYLFYFFQAQFLKVNIIYKIYENGQIYEQNID